MSVLPSRVQRDRKSGSDRTADCQNWQDIYSENTMNEIESVETSVEVVDNQEKVRHNFSRLLFTEIP